MSSLGRRRALRLVGSNVTYIAAQTHMCKRCRLTWNPEQQGPLCPDCDRPDQKPA